MSATRASARTRSVPVAGELRCTDCDCEITLEQYRRKVPRCDDCEVEAVVGVDVPPLRYLGTSEGLPVRPDGFFGRRLLRRR